MNPIKPVFQLPDGIKRIEDGAKLGIPYAAWLLANRYLMGDGVPQDTAQAARWMLVSARRQCPLGQRSYAWMLESGLIPGGRISERVAWLGAAANHGDKEAQVMLGEIYLYGRGVRANADRGMHFLKLAAQSDCKRARRILAFIDAVQTPPPDSEGEGMMKLMRQARSGCGKAAYAVALGIEDNWGLIEFDANLHAKCLDQAAAAGVAGALCDQAQALGRDPSGRMFTDEGVRLFHSAVYRGSGQAQVLLGAYYSHATVQDYKKARFWFRNALKSDFLGVHSYWADSHTGVTSGSISPQAALRLAMMSVKSGFNHARYIAAHIVFRSADSCSFDEMRAGIQGMAIYFCDYDIINHLAWQYLARSGLRPRKTKNRIKDDQPDPDHIKGLFWLQAGVEDLNTDAMKCLGEELLTKGSLSYDPASGIALMQSAAAQGDADALARVAFHFSENRELMRHQSFAAQLNLQAAEQGNAMAMHNLSVALSRGEGVKVNHDAAAYWQRRAVERDTENGDIKIEFQTAPEYKRRRFAAKVLTLRSQKSAVLNRRR